MTAVFEDANFVVQPVDGANDIGKDLYVDLTEGDRATGELIALQVKGGVSYQRVNGYAIPCSDDDRALWTSSTVPIFGVVHDPETERLCWTNLSAWARSQSPSRRIAEAPVSDGWVLNPQNLSAFVAEARSFLRASGPPALVGLADTDAAVQRSAVYDAFALGRRDARPLLILRASLRYVHDPAPLRLAIHILALCAGHGDILWSAHNWIDQRVRSRVCQEMTWSHDELVQLLRAADADEYTRGGIGQDVVALIGQGWAPDVHRQLERVVLHAQVEASWPALMILVDRAGYDGLALFDRLVPRARHVSDEPAANELRAVLAEHGCVSIW